MILGAINIRILVVLQLLLNWLPTSNWFC